MFTRAKISFAVRIITGLVEFKLKHDQHIIRASLNASNALKVPPDGVDEKVHSLVLTERYQRTKTSKT